MFELPPIHLIIPTHTPRYLDIALAGAARQSVRPATITVTSDVLDQELDRLIEQCAERFGLDIRYVRRASQGSERLAQVRNNAVSALLDDGIDEGRVLFIDGDTVASATCVEQHATLGSECDMVLPSRIMLTERQTESCNADDLLSGKTRIEPTQAQLEELGRAHRRAEAHARLRLFGLTKAHKPKLLGGHHCVSLDAYRRVNGYDEEYHTYGTEDDDFCRRLYASGARSVVAIRDILVFHLHHATRAPQDWHNRPNARRFQRRDLPVRCRHGLDSSLPQQKVRINLFRPMQKKNIATGGASPAGEGGDRSAAAPIAIVDE